MEASNDGHFLPSDTATRTQYGAICWRRFHGQLQVLLITSRDTRRWIIPKGWPIAGLSPEGVALLEAWEEAGVEGIASPSCMGLYFYRKVLAPGRALPCIVAVHGVKVTRLRDRFPERHQRLRKWFTPEKAARKVEEEGLRRILASLTLVALPGTSG